jgi:hypothetical protein
MRRRLVLAGLVLALHAVPVAQGPPPSPALQADGIVRLLASLETALQSGRSETLGALIAVSLPEEETQPLAAIFAGRPVSSVSIRERARRPVDDGFEVLTEVFISRGRRGRIATWQMGVRARGGDSSRFELTRLSELAAIGDLLRLELDASRQFALRDLVFEGPDFTLRMASGSAFVAESDNGVTAVVLRGAGTVHFAPPSEAEQGQVMQFVGKPTLTSDTDSVFIRLNPAEFARRISEQSLRPTPVRPQDLARAQELFAVQSTRTYNLDLRDLSRERWSLEPAYGSIVVEFRTRGRGWLTYARSPNDAEDISLFDRALRRNVSVYASAERLAQRGPADSDDDRAPYTAEHYALDVRFDPVRSWVAGRATVQLRTRQTVSSLTLRLADNLTITSLRSPEFGHLLTLRIVGQNSFIINLPQGLPPGHVVLIEIEYSGRLDPQALNREAMSVEAQQAAQSLTSSTGITLTPEPRFLYSSNLFWYPQSSGGDYATATMRVTVPSEYQLVGSGSLVGSRLTSLPGTPGRGSVQYERTSEYRADRPVRYLSCVISRFASVGKVRAPVTAVAAALTEAPPTPGGGITPGVNIEVLATPRQTGSSRALPARVAAIVAFYARQLGEAPYPDFTLATLDDNLPGGHSPAYFAVLNQALPTTPFSWASDPVAFANYPGFFLAHEVAHQWWGQAVGWKNYHDQWLSEGLSQYFAWLYASSDRGPEAGRSLLKQMRESALTFAEGGPISLGYRLGHLQENPRIFRALVYNKATLVLQMLRRLMGDERFFRAMRRFYESSRFQKAGTSDFQQVFQADTPFPLQRFVDRWILGTRLPQLRVAARVDQTGRVAIVRIEQLGEVFDLPYDVTVVYVDGRSDVVTLTVGEAVSEHRLALSGPVRRIETKDDLLLGTIVR